MAIVADVAGCKQGPDVYLGRFALPEACVLHVLSFLPRLPGLLRVAGVSPYFRRLTQENVLWEQLDLSWDTLARDPICLRMTDEILVDLMQRMYRKLLHKVTPLPSLARELPDDAPLPVSRRLCVLRLGAPGGAAAPCSPCQQPLFSED